VVNDYNRRVHAWNAQRSVLESERSSIISAAASFRANAAVLNSERARLLGELRDLQ
jgi:hypothetical protein